MYPSVINPQLYKSQTSLNDDIEEVSDSKRVLSFELVANIVVKYIFTYFHDTHIGRIPLESLEVLFCEILVQAINNPTREQIQENFNKDASTIFSRFHKERYPVEMLIDVPSTVEIFREIAGCIIDPQSFSGKYLGIDLGSGTGILTLAQYIQARRNGFHEINNFGIEMLEVSSSISRIIHENLGTGKIILGDTTDKQTYDFLADSDEITFITNETIPDMERSISHTIKDGDPFLANIQTIHSTGNITNETRFFPQSVEMTFLRVFSAFTRVATPENQFLSQSIESSRKISRLERGKMKWFSRIKPPEITPLTSIHISKIEVDGVRKPQEEIGEKVKTLGIASRIDTSSLRPRWLSRNKKNHL